MELFLGIDLGTSGARAAVIDATGELFASASESLPPPDESTGRTSQEANLWWAAVSSVIEQVARLLPTVGASISDIAALSVDGTSGTMLLVDDHVRPVSAALMYNSGGFDEQAETISAHAPAESITQGASSGLARAMYLYDSSDVKSASLLHQADWIAARLRGGGLISDETNSLKTGYDVVNRKWPDWMSRCGIPAEVLPIVLPVGEETGTVGRDAQEAFGLRATCTIRAGATDSNAAFLASGARKVGDGVTSLGTTLAIKMLSDRPIGDPSMGVYSHRIRDMWLAGGASNVGGGTLRKFFNASQILDLQPRMIPDEDTGLDFYPLPSPGERFPVADANLQPRLEPRPENDATFLQGILEGIARVEAQGYAALQKIGGPAVERILTAGGGAMNEPWRRIRERYVKVPVLRANQGDAAIGAARIAAGLI